MTGCPGYLNVVINDRDEREELFRYDTIISCPPIFNITFYIPNKQMKMDKSFDLLLDDAKQQYRMFLTSLDIAPESNSNSEALGMTSMAWVNGTAEGLPLLAIVLIIVFCMIVGFFLSYMALEVTKRLYQGSSRYRKVDNL